MAAIVAGCAVCSGYPLVSSKLAKMLGFKGYLLGVTRYTDVTVQYEPRFRGHGSIRFRYNRKENLLCSVSFHLF